MYGVLRPEMASKPPYMALVRIGGEEDINRSVGLKGEMSYTIHNDLAT